MAGMLLFAVFITGMLFGILAMTSKLVEGQRAQMRQQFHSDLITLVALLGDDGIQVFKRPRAELTTKQRHAAALLLQRCIVSYVIRDAFTKAEWLTIEKEWRELPNMPALKETWQVVREWYDTDRQALVDRYFSEAPRA